jgi:prolyl-tRNA synthetase
MLGREFMMKDAYSFDVDEAAALRSYEIMYDAYKRIFDRCGLTYRPVEADTGNIGGSNSHEFQVLADSGEDAITSCSSCDYTANVELAEIGAAPPRTDGDFAAIQKVDTPQKRTVDEVTSFLGVSSEKLVKTLIYMADGKPVAVLVRGDTEANELKIRRLLGAEELTMADDAEVATATGAPVGFAGPVGLEIPIIADHLVAGMSDFVVGANEGDTHYAGANWGRDFEVGQFGDLRFAARGDVCARCGGTFEAYRGIEVGQVFYLGTKYSESMDAKFLDSDGKSQPFVMGCYGIGITRILSAAIEQHNDENGIIWPMALAPYQVTILALQTNKEEVMEAATRLHDELEARGVEVLLDDRKERPGFKFKDADLIGIPIRLTIGTRGVAEGVVELKLRDRADKEVVPIAEVVDSVVSRIQGLLG